MTIRGQPITPTTPRAIDKKIVTRATTKTA